MNNLYKNRHEKRKTNERATLTKMAPRPQRIVASQQKGILDGVTVRTSKLTHKARFPVTLTSSPAHTSYYFGAFTLFS